MRNKGEVRVGFIGLLFVVLLVLVILGKLSGWHLILFPFYILGGCFGIALSVVLCIALLVFVVWLMCKILDKM